jgi:hypothetical protein
MLTSNWPALSALRFPFLGTAVSAASDVAKVCV